jgi:putative toxin-antitoxin system antitoxin component (TIGR02293 family)
MAARAYNSSMPAPTSTKAELRSTIHFKNRGASLGLKSFGTPALIQQIERGFPFQALLRLESQSGIGIALLSSLIGIPERTLARRKTAGRLTPEESERLFRISSIVERAVELFEGNMDAAVNWLLTPRKALDHQQPLHYCRTELGAREVESLIGRLEHGVFS